MTRGKRDDALIARWWRLVGEAGLKRWPPKPAKPEPHNRRSTDAKKCDRIVNG